MSSQSPSGVYVTCVMAASLDGAIAAHAHERDDERRELGFLAEADHARVSAILHESDAVIIGGRTLAASGAAWELVNDQGRVATWVVVSNALLPAELAFWRQAAIERWLVAAHPYGQPLPDESVRVLTHGGSADWPKRLLAELARAGMRRVVLFGGGEINRLFFAAGLVDALKLTLCPCILGARDGVPLVRPALPTPVRLELVSSQVSGHLVFLDYIIQKS